MGFDKLTALFDGEPLARRVARALLELEPLVVTTPQVAAVLRDLPGVHIVETSPTAGPSATLAIASAAIELDAYVAALAFDLPFLDAGLVRAFVSRVPDGVDLAWPLVGGTPGHPVIWSPTARARIAALGAGEPPSRIRTQNGIRAAAIDVDDDAYIVDVDTPGAWTAAEERARSARR